MNSSSFICAGRRLIDLAQREVQVRRAGLSELAVGVLLLLHDSPGLVSSAISRQLGRDKTTVSRVISSLVDSGLVRSQMDTLDGRRRVLHLTHDGLSVIRPAANLLIEQIETCTGDQPTETIDSMAKVLKRLNK
jgi:DNA-binding MarR family transcriptional regulator